MKVDRREFLILTGASLSGIACGGLSRLTPTPQTEEQAPQEPTQRATERPQAPPTTEPAPRPELDKGVLWQIPLAENFLYPASVEGIPSSPAPSTVWSGDRLFARGENRFVQEVDLRSGQELWKWNQRGVVLAADEERVFIQDEDDFVHILEANSKREINQFALPRLDKAFNQPASVPEEFIHRWPGLLNEHTFIQLQADWFHAFTRNGEYQTGVGGGATSFAALKGNTLIYEAEGISISYYVPGEGQSRFAYAFERADKEGLSFAIAGDYIAVVGPRAVKGIEWDVPLFYLFHIPTKREIAQVELPAEVTSPSGVFMAELGKNPDTGKPQLGIHIEQPDYENPGKYGFVWLQVAEDGEIYDMRPEFPRANFYFEYADLVSMGVRDGWRFYFDGFEFKRKTLIS